MSAEIRQTNEHLSDDDDEDLLLDDCVVYDIVTEPQYRSNSGLGFVSTVTLTAHSHSYTAAKTIIQQVRASWERQTFSHGAAKISSCFVDDETAEQDEDGIWSASVDIRMTHSVA